MKNPINTSITLIKPYTSVNIYATIQQGTDLIQYGPPVHNVVFYQFNNTQDAPVKIAEIDNFGLHSVPHFFMFQHSKIKKPVAHRNMKSIKRTECFSFIGDTLYISTDHIGFKGPWYEKKEHRPSYEQDTDKINYSLVQHISWSNGTHTRDLWFDQLDYQRLTQQTINQHKLRESVCKFIGIHQARCYEMAWCNIADDLIKRLQWWRDATVKELIKSYNEYMLELKRPDDMI